MMFDPTSNWKKFPKFWGSQVKDLTAGTAFQFKAWDFIEALFHAPQLQPDLRRVRKILCEIGGRSRPDESEGSRLEASTGAGKAN